MTEDPGTSILFDVFALGQSVQRLLSAAMHDGPLSPAEYALYSAVFELEAATPTRLAARLGMRLTTFMDQLRLLEARGHAARVEHPTDGRSYRVVLTSAGLEAHRGANRLFEAARAAVAARLPQGEAAAQACLATILRAAEGAAGAISEGAGATPRRRPGLAG